MCDGVLDCSDHSDAENCSRGLDGAVYLQPSDIPRQCPNVGDIPAVCDAPRCRAGGCQEGEACCDTGCGSMTCTAGVPSTPICLRLREQATGLIGAFQPSCEEDGSFSEMQCHGSTGYCWCVDVESGQPVSDGVRGRPTCGSCARGSGETIPIGRSFSSTDGCNTWLECNVYKLIRFQVFFIYCSKCTKDFGIICTSRHCLTSNELEANNQLVAK